MNSSFSFQRVGLLIKRNLIEDYIPFIGVPVLLIIGFAWATPLNADIRLLVYMFGLIIPLRQFAPLNNSISATHILLIPSSNAEKMMATILLGTVCFVCITLLTFVIGSLAGTYIFNLITGKDTLVNWSFISNQGMLINGYNPISPRINIWDIFRITFILQNLIMLVQIGLKDKKLIKLFGFLTTIIILILAQPNVYYTLFNYITKDSSHNWIDSINKTSIPTVVTIIGYLIIPILWRINYSLLSNKQL